MASRDSPSPQPPRRRGAPTRHAEGFTAWKRLIYGKKIEAELKIEVGNPAARRGRIDALTCTLHRHQYFQEHRNMRPSRASRDAITCELTDTRLRRPGGQCGLRGQIDQGSIVRNQKPVDVPGQIGARALKLGV